MLVMTKTPGQEVVVDHPAGPVTVKVIDCGFGKVRLGIDAPAEVLVYRSAAAAQTGFKAGRAVVPAEGV